MEKNTYVFTGLIYKALTSSIPSDCRFGGNVKVVHFLGAWKPWMVNMDPNTRRVVAPPQYDNPQTRAWLAIFQDHVLPKLSPTAIGNLVSENSCFV